MNDVELLAYAGWMEDRSGIGFAYGVMHVVMNRVHSPAFPNTIHDVIYQPNAFSFTRPDNPEYGLRPSGPVYEACLAVAPTVIAGDDDPTLGAVWYANEKYIDKDGWYDRNIIQSGRHPILVVIGKHTFRG
jgi:N-acetylmuramoyl-L-alanine amidase